MEMPFAPDPQFTLPHSLLCPLNFCGAWMGAGGLCEEAEAVRAGSRTWLRMSKDYGIGMTGWEASRREWPQCQVKTERTQVS